MIPLLADATVDPMISGNWIIAVIGALASALALFYGKRQGIKEATNNITLTEPVPTISTRKVLTPPSWDQHKALSDRVLNLEERFTSHERLQTERFIKLMEAGENRKDAILEKFSKDLGQVYDRINQLADVLRNRKP